MSEKIKVLIVEDHVDFSRLLNEHLSIEPDIRVVGQAYDGNEGLELVKKEEPDVVVLDIIMPNLDGIGLLEKVAEEKPVKRPSFIVLTAIGQDIFIKRAIELGADYYMVKPFDISNLIMRIRQVYKWNHLHSAGSISMFEKSGGASEGVSEVEAIEAEVTKLVRNMGIPAHKSGYQYIIEAIVQTIENDNYFGAVTKTLYPFIAEKYKTTPQKVERSIRHLIENTWMNGNQNTISSLFGNGVLTRCRPTNSEFIAMVADKVKLHKEKQK